MSKILSFLGLILITISLSAQPRKLIFDTDFGGDADDLGALAMLNHFVNSGTCELLAVMCWNVEPDAVGAIDAVNTFYGNPDIPIGARKDQGEPLPWQHSKVIADQFPHDLEAADAEESTTLYRRILVASEDKELTIVTVGPLSNILRLIQSPPDNISPLSGKELITEKVREFVIMGGQFPSGPKEWNFDGNMPGVTIAVLAEIEVPIVFSGFEVGLGIRTAEVFNEIDKNTPLYVGFLHFSKYAPWFKGQYQGKIYDNATYDQTAVLYAVSDGVGEYWEKVTGGYCKPDSVGGNVWVAARNTNHSYLKLIKPNEEMAALIEDLMLNRLGE